MGQVITLDVIDRPTADARRLVKSLRPGAGGSVTLIRAQTNDFLDHWFGNPRRLRRLAVIGAWEADADVQDDWRRLLAPATDGCREHWHVRGELTRAAFDSAWLGWNPDVDGARPHADDEPALVFIAGDLRPRGLLPFLADAQPTVRFAHRQPGYLGGLGLYSSLLNTTSCSAWATYAHAKAYAYGDGRHRRAMLADRKAGRHHTNWFFRVRPLESRGTLRGRDPFAGVVAAA